MTVEEIKAQYSMMDIVARYGLQPNHAGFITCPFHSEKTASLKIYKDNFHCYGCGANGDIFTFVMLMENCDFKTAFHQLGGEYSGKGLSDAAVLRIKRIELERQKKERIMQQARDKYLNACNSLHEAEEKLKGMEPMSSEWCDAQNALVGLRASADEALEELLNLQK